MRKAEFLDKIKSGLSGVPMDDIEERLSFYSEMIDDKIEEGFTEDEAISEFGTVEEIVAQITSELSLVKLVKERIKPKRTLRAWETILIGLGSPIWLSLLIAGLSVVFSVYTAIWSIIISLWAAELAFAATSFAGMFYFVYFIIQGNALGSVAMLGICIAFAGFGILGFFGFKAVTKGILIFTGKIFTKIKRCFIKRGEIR